MSRGLSHQQSKELLIKGFLLDAVEKITDREIKSLIKEAIPDAEISIEDLAGDENHYSATVKSKVFSGKSMIEQHKLVYKALGEKMIDHCLNYAKEQGFEMCYL